MRPMSRHASVTALIRTGRLTDPPVWRSRALTELSAIPRRRRLEDSSFGLHTLCNSRDGQRHERDHMSEYAVAHLSEIDELNDGRCAYRPVRHHFGITAFGV